MKKTDLMEAIGSLPEDLVRTALELPRDAAVPEDFASVQDPFAAEKPVQETAVPDAPRRHLPAWLNKFTAIGAVAACAALIAGSVWLIGRLTKEKQQIVTPRTAVESVETEPVVTNPDLNEQQTDLFTEMSSEIVPTEHSVSAGLAEKWYDCLTDDIDAQKIDSEKTVPEFPDLVFRWVKPATDSSLYTQLYVYEADNPGSPLFGTGGYPVLNAYFADVNSDGYPDLCITLCNGMQQYGYNQVEIWDIHNHLTNGWKSIYSLPVTAPVDESKEYSYTLFCDNGRMRLKRKSIRSFQLAPNMGDQEIGDIVFESGFLAFRPLSTEENTSVIQYRPGSVQTWFDSSSKPCNPDELEKSLQIAALKDYRIDAKTEYGAVESIWISRPYAKSLRIGGCPVWNAYLADLNGDGSPELCTSITQNSYILSDAVYVYDFRSEMLYTLEKPGEMNYSLSCENGVLLAKMRRYPDSPRDADAVCIAGALGLVNGRLTIDSETAEEPAVTGTSPQNMITTEQTDTITTTDPNHTTTTTDPNEKGGGKTIAETQAKTEQQVRELPFKVRYQFCEGDRSWRTELDDMTRKGDWNLNDNQLIRSYDELKKLGLSGITDYSRRYFENSSLILCVGMFDTAGKLPEIKSVQVVPCSNNAPCSITVSAERMAGSDRKLQRWLCFIEVNDSDLGSEVKTVFNGHFYHSAVVNLTVSCTQNADDTFYYADKSACCEWISLGHPYQLHSELKGSDVTLRFENNQITVIRKGVTVTTIAGMPLVNAYLTDLNGDGFNELCMTLGMGSGIYYQFVAVYDIRNNQFYHMMGEKGEYTYTLRADSGKLEVLRMDGLFGSPVDTYSDIFVTGTLTLANGKLTFTAVSEKQSTAEVIEAICQELAGLSYSSTDISNGISPHYQLTAADGTVYQFTDWHRAAASDALYVKIKGKNLWAKLTDAQSRRLTADSVQIGAVPIA